MFAIIGANGNAGAAAARALRKRGLAVRAVLRDRSKASEFEAIGCSVAIADILDQRALRAALDGVEAVQAICPVAPNADEPLFEMRAYADLRSPFIFGKRVCARRTRRLYYCGRPSICRTGGGFFGLPRRPAFCRVSITR